MESLSGGNGSLWGMGFFHSQEWNSGRRKRRSNGGKEGNNASKSSQTDSADANGGAGYRFPLKQAMTASSLSLTGDTIAQFRDRWLKNKDILPNPPHAKGETIVLRWSFYENMSMVTPCAFKYNQAKWEAGINNLRDMIGALLSEHDWPRSIRMASYGFLLYGPGTYAWYSYLDRCMPKQSVENVLMKVLLNQIVLGPAVIAVIFAWNNLWVGKLSDLPNKYQKDALPTLLFGFRFWVPVSILNFCNYEQVTAVKEIDREEQDRTIDITVCKVKENDVWRQWLKPF